MEIRTMIESYLGMSEHLEFSQIDSAIQQALPSIFDKSWPIFNETYRPVLEAKIIKWNWLREIGTETTGEFKLLLNSKLARIMPYYNQLYESELLKFEPFNDVNYTHESNRTTTREEDLSENKTANVKRNSSTDGTLDSTIDSSNSVDTSQTTNASGNVVNSDTPQGLIQDVLDKKYASSVSQSVNNETVTGKSSDTGAQTRTDSTVTSATENQDATDTRAQQVTVKDIDGFIETIRGKQNTTSYMHLLTELRETFLNIDSMILDELEELFFALM